MNVIIVILCVHIILTAVNFVVSKYGSDLSYAWVVFFILFPIAGPICGISYCMIRKNRMKKNPDLIYFQPADGGKNDSRRIFFELSSLMNTLVEKKREETKNHSLAVSGYTGIILKSARKICPEYKISDGFISMIRNATILHDIGKIEIPDSILKKNGRLNDDEFEIMKQHTVKGAELIKVMPCVRGEEEMMKHAYEIALHHHERIDGGGYPDGLTEEKIPFWVQAVSVADAYEALTSKRIYKEGVSSEKAIEMIKSGQCGAFSGKILLCLDDAKNEMENLRRQFLKQ